MDQRNEYSKKAIREALIRLSRTKPYTEISVRELCREANVSRSTFYNNYHFFNDVVVEMSEAYMEKLRGRRLTREFFDSLKNEGDELKLLLDSGMFGREFSLYLREIVQEEIADRHQRDPGDISVNDHRKLNRSTLPAAVNAVSNHVTRRTIGVLYLHLLNTFLCFGTIKPGWVLLQ